MLVRRIPVTAGGDHDLAAGRGLGHLLLWKSEGHKHRVEGVHGDHRGAWIQILSEVYLSDAEHAVEWGGDSFSR